MKHEGTNDKNETFWKLYVPDEHCTPGLEILIVATEDGLKIGHDLLTWNDIENAELLVT